MRGLARAARSAIWQAEGVDADDWRRLGEKLTQAIAAGPAVFGSDGHGWRARPPISEEEVAAFEARHGVVLPADYRWFLTQVADGGAGPYYGLYSLREAYEEAQWNTLGPLASPFPLTEAWAPATEEEARPPGLYDGVLYLAHHGCGMWSMLVVSGAARGTVWDDFDTTDGGWAPTGQTFAEWFEAWLDEALAVVARYGQELAAARGRLTGAARHDGPILAELAGKAARSGRVEEAGLLLREAGAIGHVVTDSEREPLVRHAERFTDHARAVGHIERLLAACPGFSAPHQARLRLRLGYALGGLGRHAESLEVLRELCSGPLAAALGIQVRDARKQVAYALMQFERHAEALELLDPKSRDGHEHNLIGACCSALGRHAAALAAYRRSRKLADGWIVPWDNMGFVHLKMGEVEKAITIHRAVIAKDETYAWGHYHLALALAARGELAAAETELARAAQLGYSVASVREDPYAQPLRETATYRSLTGG